MASCKQQSDCTAQEVCSDGQCVPVETPEPREVRRTFATAAGEYGGIIAGEQKVLKEFGDFLSDQLEEAAEEREEQRESTGFWGTLGSIVGFGIGCYLGGPSGCVKGAAAGSLISRGTADWMDDAESYGLTEDEFAKLDPSELKYMKGTYNDLIEDARDMQDDLDDYDRNEWKQHVLGAIGDTWNAYKMASFGETLWKGGGELLDLLKDDKKQLIDVSDTIVPDIPTGDIPTVLDQSKPLTSPYHQPYGDI